MKSEDIFNKQTSGNITLNGVIERIVYQNEVNGFTVARIRDTEKDDLITITGSLPSIKVGETISITGEWTEHKKWGRQINVKNYNSIL